MLLCHVKNHFNRLTSGRKMLLGQTTELLLPCNLMTLMMQKLDGDWSISNGTFLFHRKSLAAKHYWEMQQRLKINMERCNTTKYAAIKLSNVNKTALREQLEAKSSALPLERGSVAVKWQPQAHSESSAKLLQDKNLLKTWKLIVHKSQTLRKLLSAANTNRDKLWKCFAAAAGVRLAFYPNRYRSFRKWHSFRPILLSCVRIFNKFGRAQIFEKTW